MRQGGLGNQSAEDPGMPGDTHNKRPANRAGKLKFGYFFDFFSLKRGGRELFPHSKGLTLHCRDKKKPRLDGGHLKILASALGFSLSPAFVTSGFAAGEPAVMTALGLLDQTSILLLAIFGGAVSFALLSTFWMIRERSRISIENELLRKNFADVRADRDKLAAIAEVEDQCLVVWDNVENDHKILGMLAPETLRLKSRSDFLAFGKWLTPGSAIKLEKAVEELRGKARQFSFVLTTLANKYIEVQGRVSGGQAFARFIPLDGPKQELAELEQNHQSLLSRFELLENLFNKIPSPVWIRNRDGDLAYVNPAYAHAVEAKDIDSAVKHNKSLFDQSERTTIAVSLAESGSIHTQLPVVVAGDRRTMETISVSGSGGTCGIAIDRGDVEAIRATLKHAIASHEQTFDHLGTAIAIFDANQKLQFHNSSFQQLWGLSLADLEGQPSNSHMLDTLRDHGKLPQQPDWRRWKEHQLGIYHATETRTETWHLADGQTLRVIVNPQNHGGASWVFENVTEELALRTNYNSLVRVQGETLDHLNEAVAVFGSNGKVRLTNPAFLSLWGFETPQDVEGLHVNSMSKRIEKHLAKKDDDQAEGWSRICLGITGVDDDRNDLTGRLELGSGAILDYHLVYLPEGQSMLTLADMTAAVNIERALKERNDALEESDALKTRFIQHVSYELRAPLTSISGFAEILATGSPGALNPKQAEYLEYISRSSDVLKALIDDILDLATIDAGAMQLDLQTVDVEQIMRASVEEVAEQLERFQISTTITVSDDARRMIGDPDRIKQMLANLLSNAANVSPDGGLIELDARRNGTMIELVVTDQGPGISQSNQATIFERFETVQGSERKRGAGLGLSIVKSFSELHGGSVHVENAGKKGARFICCLPVEPAANLQAAQ